MLLQDILFAVEDFFNTNWNTTPIHFESSKAAPAASAWIHVMVRAVSSESRGYAACTDESHMIYVTCYGANQVKAAALADSVAVFIERQKLGDFITRTAEPIHQADASPDTYFYKIGIPLNN